MNSMILFCLFFVGALEYTSAKNVNSIDSLTEEKPEPRSLWREHNSRRHFSDALQDRLTFQPELAGQLHNEALEQAQRSNYPNGIPRSIYDSIIDDAVSTASAYDPEADTEPILMMITDSIYKDLYSDIKYAVASNTNARDFADDIDDIVDRASSTNRNYGSEIQVVGEIAKSSYNYWADQGYNDYENRDIENRASSMGCVVLADVGGAILGAVLFRPPLIGAIWVGAVFSIGAATSCSW